MLLFETFKSAFLRVAARSTVCIFFFKIDLRTVLVTKFVAGLSNLILVFSFSSLKHDLFLCSPWQHYSRIFGPDLPTSSTITAGMRGAKAGVNPPRRSPSLVLVYNVRIYTTWH